MDGDLNKWDKQHLINLGLTQKQIDEIYDIAVKEAAVIGISIHDFDPDKPFSFDDYPQTKVRIDKIVKELQRNTETVIVNGVRSGWTLANNKNNVLCDRVFGENKYKLTKVQERRYYSNNDTAREAFLNRKTAGLNLSDRVWNYTNQFKAEIEMGLDLGIRNGLSAVEMARDLKQYLKHPDKLFRRVRDEHGMLHLSKAAKEFNPGQGVYRSSYKNALRLARTENNMAYRTSDHNRWQQMDFVVGIEIRLSNNHTLNGVPFTDICDDLKGIYPKDFKFTGWHPACRCHAVSILKTEEELEADNERIMNGEEPSANSVNSVKDVPDNFKEWAEANKDRIERAEKRGTLPYFLKDNYRDGKVSDGLSFAIKEDSRAGATPQPQTGTVAGKGIIQTSYSNITSQVIAVENEIRMNKTFETAVAFDKNGNVVIDKRGEARKVEFTDEECRVVKDCVFTHNHPSGWNAKEGTIGRIGNSFSIQDISFAIGNDVAEIRAVTPTYTFVMKRPTNGWGMGVANLKKEYNQIEAEIRKNTNKAVYGASTRQEMELAADRANASFFHLVWKKFSKKHGIEYNKKKTK